MDIKVRAATPEDVQEVYRFVCELEEIIFDTDKFYQYYFENICKQDHHYLVAETGEDLVGYISCHGQVLLHHLGKVYEIQELYVDKEYRDKGIGRLLIDSLIGVLDKEEYDMLEVASGMKRVASHAFYRHCGFDQSHYKFTRKGNTSLDMPEDDITNS